MGDDKLVDLAEQVGSLTTCIEVVKGRLAELDKQPSLPRWICKASSGITITIIVAVAAGIGGQILTQYRLSQVEKVANRNSQRFERLVGAIADELAQEQTEPMAETLALTPPVSGRRRVGVHLRPTGISYSAPRDSAQASRIRKRLQARIDGGS